MSDDDDEAWFGPSRYNRRLTRPVAWQGWAACIGFGLLIAGAAFLATISWIGAAAVFVVGGVAFVWIVAQKTSGGGKD